MPADGRSWWARRSLRLRLTAAAAVVMTVGLVGAAALLVVWLHVSLISGLDRTALQRARVVASYENTDRSPAEVPLTDHGEVAVQVADAEGRGSAGSAHLRGRPRVFDFPVSRSAAPRARTVHDIPAGDRGTWRALGVPAGTTRNPMTVYVAGPTEGVDNSLAQLTAGLATGVLVVVALLTAIMWLLTGRALRPVDAMRAQTAEITASDLSRRVHVPPDDDVLGRLARTFNDLLARLDTANQRQRRLIADAAHELRTPSAPCTPASKSPCATSAPPTGRPPCTGVAAGDRTTLPARRRPAPARPARRPAPAFPRPTGSASSGALPRVSRHADGCAPFAARRAGA
ncbi:HAMP domain-containing protein [Streptomyces sp. NPDC015184]|uniref:HAMP domain-containing protein n=1 Tax=Streptomyces sp. NPDC015184 TaxID=3364946 RepID=UPI0036F6BA27